MVPFPLIRIQSSVTYPDMLPPHKVRLNEKSTTLRLTMIFKQPLTMVFKQFCHGAQHGRGAGRRCRGFLLTLRRHNGSDGFGQQGRKY